MFYTQFPVRGPQSVVHSPISMFNADCMTCNQVFCFFFFFSGGEKSRELRGDAWLQVMFISLQVNRVFSHDVMAAILVSQNNEMAAMLVSQTNPLGVELFSDANAFFCFNKFA